MTAKILVVDDDANSRLMLQYALEAEGYQVISAEDGQEGFDRAQAECPDLIITDIAMPNVDGVEMIRMLRGVPNCQAVPVLALSAYQSGVLTEAIRAGASGAAQKPVQITSLLELVKRLLVAALFAFNTSWACGA